MKKQITATISETTDSLYSVEINTNGHVLVGDEPESYGSKNLGPAPYDFLITALGECTVMTIRWYAIKEKYPLENASVVITHHKEGRQDIFSKKVTITGSELTEEQMQKLHEVAEKCPVQRTLQSEVVIETL